MPKSTPPIAAVIGYPIHHSLSPLVFEILSRKLCHPLIYRRLEVTPSQLSDFFRGTIRERAFVGWNVTIPHKEIIIKLADRLSPEAKSIGAANVIRFSSGKAIGYNTDTLGVTATFKEQGLALRRKTACLFGAGGAARAVAYSLGKEGAATVWVINRTSRNAVRFCRHFNRLFAKTRFLAAKETGPIGEPVSCIVNATPIGLKGIKGTFKFPTSVAPRALAFDLLYRSHRSPFLKTAERHGIRSVNGLDMFIWQAIATWEIWFGKVTHRTRLKEQLKKEIKRCCAI